MLYRDVKYKENKTKPDKKHKRSGLVYELSVPENDTDRMTAYRTDSGHIVNSAYI